MPDTVLITGISGFIAKSLAASLLDRGLVVRGTVRDSTREREVRSSLERAGHDVTRLQFVAADLGAPTGWNQAVRDCRFVFHVASPFPSFT